MTIQSISEKLLELATKLEAGVLNANEIMTMTELSRQLHERLIVLQYKAFEQQVQIDTPNDGGEPEEAPAIEHENPNTVAGSEPQLVLTQKGDIDAQSTESAEAVSEPKTPVFRVTEPEVSPNQISLIDSIEEIKRMEQSINETYKASDGPSLAQRLNHKPIVDLSKAIGINKRFQFVTNLFDDDSDAFDNAVKQINDSKSYIEADEYVQNTLKNRYDWQMKNPVVKEFIHLIERRFL